MHENVKLKIVSIVGRKILNLEYIAVSDKLWLGQTFRSLLIHMQLTRKERISVEQFENCSRL